MKFKDLVKFIENEVEQITKSTDNVDESSSVESEPAQYKPVTINIKRENKPIKEKDLEEEDFAEIMFKKIEENFLRIKIKNMIVEMAGAKDISPYEVYNDTFSSACQQAIDYIEKKGYKIKDEDWFTQVSTGPRKPDPGKTNRYSVELTKMGFPSNKHLHFQVYGMESGKYELNAYVS